jgi:vancomycin resistance protein YoaR
MKASLSRKLLALALLILPLSLATVCYATYPFSDTIAKKTLSLTGLNSAQKSNIQLAAGAMNGVVLRSGEEFSFNKIVGPRTTGRGYRPAPSYLGPENPATIGGGICLVSSAVYQLALETGCSIDQRVAHLRTIRTVPAGLDSTVWYGQADLKFRNDLPCPVQISTKWENNSLTVEMLGKQPANYSPAKVNVSVERRTSREMIVEVFRRQGEQESRISRDCYIVSRTADGPSAPNSNRYAR